MDGKSEWEKQTDKAQASLGALGVPVSPEIARLVAEVRDLGGGPQQEARAKLDLVITKGISDGILGLTEATNALVKSSDENTNTMARIGRGLNGLTAGLLAFSAVQVGLAYFKPAQPIQVNVPAPVVQMVPPPAPTPVPPSPSPQPAPSQPKRKSKRPT